MTRPTPDDDLEETLERSVRMFAFRRKDRERIPVIEGTRDEKGSAS